MAKQTYWEYFPVINNLAAYSRHSVNKNCMNEYVNNMVTNDSSQRVLQETLRTHIQSSAVLESRQV